MDKMELKALIAGGEDQQLEFKSKLDKASVGKVICGFANANAGTLLIGVADNKEIVGTDETISPGSRDKVEEIARSMEPSVDVHVSAVGKVLCVTIPEQHYKPYAYHGKYYIRKGSHSPPMNRNELVSFLHSQSVLRFDEMPCREFSLENDLSDVKLNSFLKRAGLDLPADQNREDVLRSRKLIDSQGLMTNAGALILAQDSRKFSAGWETKCTLYQADELSILDTREFHSDIAANIDEICAWLLSKINISVIVSGSISHEKMPEVPEEVLREVVTNALVHRDYQAGGHAQVSVFADRIEVYNPGGLPKGMTETMLGRRRLSVPRNELLFQTLQDMEIGERTGSGIQRIRTLCRESGLPQPKFEPSEDAFTATIFRQPVHGAPAAPQAGRHAEAGTLAEQVLRLITQHGTLSATRIAELIGVSVNTGGFRKALRQLLSDERIEYTLPDKPSSGNQKYRLRNGKGRS